MISVKAILAMSLTGAGTAVMTTNAYLLTRAPHSAAPVAAEVVKASPAPQVQITALPRDPEPERILMLPAVTVYAHIGRPARHAAEPLLPCSDWRALSSGPADRGVRTLCKNTEKAQ